MFIVVAGFMFIVVAGATLWEVPPCWDRKRHLVRAWFEIAKGRTVSARDNCHSARRGPCAQYPN